MFHVDQTPKDIPKTFDLNLVPQDQIIHRGIFSNDLNQYYFTISNRDYSDFKVLVSNKIENQWSKPKEAFFNSAYDEHGMSFSPDGNTLVFSSTRPVGIDSIPNTWHIWICKKNNEKWSEPEYLNIANLQPELISHPTLAPNGTIYFHASNLDYSEMSIYYTTLLNGQYQSAKKLDLDLGAIGYCTPYISSTGDHLIFASIGESLDLYICSIDNGKVISKPIKLSKEINKNGQGNPYLTPDSKYLFFTSKDESHNWSMNWVSTEGIID